MSYFILLATLCSVSDPDFCVTDRYNIDKSNISGNTCMMAAPMILGTHLFKIEDKWTLKSWECVEEASH